VTVAGVIAVIAFFGALWLVTGEAPWSSGPGDRRRARKAFEARGCTCYEKGGSARPLEYRRSSCPIHKDQLSPWT